MKEPDVFDLLHRRYEGAQQNGTARQWVCMEHVPNYSFGASQIADFIAFNVWHSKREFHGHEVKVTRADWLKELKQPHKAEAWKRHMNRWWLVVSDPKIVKDGELPEGWGLMVVQSNGALVIKKKAPRLKPEPISDELRACMLRATQKTAAKRAIGPQEVILGECIDYRWAGQRSHDPYKPHRYKTTCYGWKPRPALVPMLDMYPLEEPRFRREYP